MKRINKHEMKRMAEKFQRLKFQFQIDAGRLMVGHTEHDKERRIAGKIDNLWIDLEQIITDLYEQMKE